MGLNLKKGAMILLTGVLLTTSFTGCARFYDSNEANEVSIEDTNQYYTYETGVVTYVKSVVLKDEGNSGALMGGGTGLVLGSMVGKGKGNTLAMLLGALGGALVGHYAGKGNGQELGVRLADGREVVILVKTSHETFHPGDRIRIIKDGNRIVRVERM